MKVFEGLKLRLDEKIIYEAMHRNKDSIGDDNDSKINLQMTINNIMNRDKRAFETNPNPLLELRLHQFFMWYAYSEFRDYYKNNIKPLIEN